MHDGNILVGQSGGPTAVINASLAGVVHAARGAGFGNGASSRGKILGMRFAIEGFMEGRTVDLGELSHEEIEALRVTPGSALGSCRYKLSDEDLPRIGALLREHDVRYLFYIGGNDTMDTINRISAWCHANDWDVRGIGIPKTVDNDLYATDHTPGYASAARYVALSVAQAGRLAKDMQRVDRFVVHQTVGRDAGWLAAASALARRHPGDAPHLIYIPEDRLTPEIVIDDVRRVVDTHGWASIVVGEGVLWQDGTPVSASRTNDRFNNVEFGAMGGASAALSLHRLISEATGWRGEFQIPESMPMAADDRVGPHDRAEAWSCGVEAVALALRGVSGVMVAISRDSTQPYRVSYGTAPLGEVAVRARPMPPEMYTHGDVTDVFLDYLRPLVGPLDPYFDLAAAVSPAVKGSV
jgi:ATP-dependent phosphofructokinase / diphosphate-dependent phosphofructokinase